MLDLLFLREVVASRRMLPHDYAVTLLDEIDRLREGRFTSDELQNLCHNLTPGDACEFREGCEKHQRMLFGDVIVDNLLAREHYGKLWIEPIPVEEARKLMLESGDVPDYGIQLDCVDGENVPAMDVLWQAVNNAVADHGYKIRSMAEWATHRKACAREEEFIQKLRSKDGKTDHDGRAAAVGQEHVEPGAGSTDR